MSFKQPNPTGGLQPDGNAFRPLWLWLVVGAAVILIILVVLALTHNSQNSGSSAATGEIIVSTNDQNSAISLVWLGDPSKGQNASLPGGTGSLDSHIPAGPYSVTVSNLDLSASQIVTVTAGKTVRITLNPGKLGTAEPVTDRDTTNLAADNSSLHYTAADTGNLYAVSSGNAETLVDASHGFTRISWADSSYGVGKAKNGQLFVINNTAITPVSSPVNTAAPQASFSLSPDRRLYVSDGTQVFTGQPGGSFNKLYQSSDGAVTILAAGVTAAVISKNNATGAPGNGQLITITPSGTLHQRSGEAYQAAWSPSGKYLVLSGDESTLVTDSALNQLGSIPANNITSPVWLNDNDVFYGITSGLWRYDTHTNQANLLANMPQSAYVNTITPSSDYVYVLLQTTNAQTGDDVFNLDRLGLKGQSASATATSLSDLLPYPIGPCTIGYLNFTQTHVVVRGPAGSAASCTQGAKGFLQPYTSIIGPSLPIDFNQN